MPDHLAPDIENKDDIPEGLEDYYAEREEGGFTLQVKGVDLSSLPDLVSSFEKQKRENKKLKDSIASYGDDTPDTIKELRKQLSERPDSEELARRISNMRSEHDAAIKEKSNEIMKWKGFVRTSQIDNELKDALRAINVREEQVNDVADLLRFRHNPDLEEADGKVRGVFMADHFGLPGQALSVRDWVKKWGESDLAKPYIKPKGKQGTGASPSFTPTPAGGTGNGISAMGSMTAEQLRALSTGRAKLG